MILPYTRIKDKSSGYCVHRPYLDVYIWSGVRNVRTRGLLDSGADGILINKDYANIFNIDLKKIKPTPHIGINGIPIDVWKYQLEVEVDNLPNSKYAMEVGFINSPSVGVLLGRKDFFDKFMIKFENYSLMFEIDFPQLP